MIGLEASKHTSRLSPRDSPLNTVFPKNTLISHQVNKYASGLELSLS